MIWLQLGLLIAQVGALALSRHYIKKAEKLQ